MRALAPFVCHVGHRTGRMQNLDNQHRDHGLHGRLMADMAALHRQLRSLVDHALGTVDPITPPPRGTPVPPPDVSKALRRAMVAGWIDRVARRVRARDAAHQSVRV